MGLRLQRPEGRVKRLPPPEGIFAYAPTSISLEATVIRADGTEEQLGEVAYFHKNPLKRLAWRLRHRDFASRITH